MSDKKVREIYPSREPSSENTSQVTEDSRDSSVDVQKREEILEACKTQDVKTLVNLSTSEGGLLEDDIRRIAWPILLAYDISTQNQEDLPWADLPAHSDEDQVKLDVNRAFVHYPSGNTEKQLEGKKADLLDLITSILRRNSVLCYFQGYHDIAQVFLLVLGREEAFSALEKTSLFRIRDYMLPSLSPALRHLHLLPSILKVTDEQLCDYLSGTKPFFALASTLTLYAHDVQEYTDIARLYDFILAHEPVVSIYLFATIILSRKEELFDIPVDEPEMIHFTLSKLPKPLNLESLVSNAIEMYRNHPPESLPFGAWRTISEHSVLKTLRNPTSHSTREQAYEHFEKQMQELRREERRERAIALLRRHSRSIRFVGAAVFIGLLSYWLMKRNPDMNRLGRYFGRVKSVFSW